MADRTDDWRIAQTAWAPLEPRRSRRPLVVGALVGIVLAIAGFAVGRKLAATHSETPAGVGSGAVVGGRLALTGGSGWLALAQPKWTRALLPGAVAAQPVANPAVTVLLGDLKTGGVATLLRGLTWDPSGVGELQRGALRVRTYTGTFPDRTDMTGEVMLVATEDGASAALCVAADRLTTTPQDDCSDALSSLAVHDADPVSASPAADASRRLRDAMATFDRARRAGAAALAAQTTAGRQANAADTLRAAYDTAARAVADVPATPLAADALGSLARDLRDGAAAYRALAAAADADSAQDFRAARADALAADRRARSDLAALGSLGYGDATA